MTIYIFFSFEQILELSHLQGFMPAGTEDFTAWYVVIVVTELYTQLIRCPWRSTVTMRGADV